MTQNDSYLMVSERTSVVESGPRLAIVTAGILLATLLELVDTTIVNVALPVIQGSIGASQEEGAFVVTGYLVANTVIIPLTPWLQTRFGRKQYYLASILLFSFGSFMCALSASLSALVLWRVVQGVGGGGLISTSQAILRDTFPDDRQAAAQGIFAIGAVVGPTIGPILGGVLTDAFSWQLIFLVNIPLGLLAAFIVWRFLRNSVAPARVTVDEVGIVLLAVGLGSLQYVLDQGNEKDWFADQWIVIMSWTAAMGLLAFVFWELRAKTPIVDLRILHNRSVAVGSILALCLGVSLVGSLVTIPQYVEQNLSFTATLAGEVILFRAIFVMIFTPLSARLAATGRVDPRLQIGVGFAVLGISNWWLADVTTSGSDLMTFFWPLALSGLALSQVFVPLSLAMFGSVEETEVNKASAMFNLSRQMGGSIATAVLLTMVTHWTTYYQDRIAGQLRADRAAIRSMALSAGKQGERALGVTLAGVLQSESQVLAYADASRFVGTITLLCAPLAVFLKPARRGARTRVVMET